MESLDEPSPWNVCRTIYGLRPSRSVLVHDPTDALPLTRDHVCRERHEGAKLRVDEPFARVFLENARSKRPPTLAILDGVHAILNTRMAWMRRDAPEPERSWSILKAPHSPANHVSGVESLSRYGDGVSIDRLKPVPHQDRVSMTVIDLGPEARRAKRSARLLSQKVCGLQGRS